MTRGVTYHLHQKFSEDDNDTWSYHLHPWRTTLSLSENRHAQSVATLSQFAESTPLHLAFRVPSW